VLHCKEKHEEIKAQTSEEQGVKRAETAPPAAGGGGEMTRMRMDGGRRGAVGLH
jgi:hypothetical protein